MKEPKKTYYEVVLPKNERIYEDIPRSNNIQYENPRVDSEKKCLEEEHRPKEATTSNRAVDTGFKVFNVTMACLAASGAVFGSSTILTVGVTAVITSGITSLVVISFNILDFTISLINAAFIYYILSLWK